MSRFDFLDNKELYKFCLDAENCLNESYEDVRKLLEVCAKGRIALEIILKNIAGKDFYSKTCGNLLKYIKEKKLVEETVLEKFKEANILGNLGAHYDPNKPISKENAKRMVDVLVELCIWFEVKHLRHNVDLPSVASVDRKWIHFYQLPKDNLDPWQVNPNTSFKNKCKECFSAACDDNIEAQVQMGYFRAVGNEECSKEPVIAVAYYAIAAEKGQHIAMGNLAYCYEIGFGMEAPDKEQAFSWYEKAVEAYPRDDKNKNGYNRALYKLAHCYELGIGTTENLEKAKELYLVAAEAGDAWAQNKMGDLCVAEAEAAAEEQKAALYKSAYDWYLKAAKFGDKQGQYKVCLLLDENKISLGNDMINKGYARMWCEKAKSNRLPEALWKWGKYKDEEKNYEAALDAYLSAAKLGHAGAKYELGNYYYSGTCCEEDIYLALSYWREAANEQCQEAKEMLENAYTFMRLKNKLIELELLSEKGKLSNGKAFTFKYILGPWLVKEEYLEPMDNPIVEIDGKEVEMYESVSYRVTEKGTDAGISVFVDAKNKGNLQYNVLAQRFIINNMENMISFAEEQEKAQTVNNEEQAEAKKETSD